MNIRMMQAIWNGQVIAQSNNTVVVEGNHYFPADTVDPALLSDSDTTSFCGWKGHCRYYHLTVNGKQNPDAVWYYPEPYSLAEEIRGHVAFWKGVEVKEV